MIGLRRYMQDSQSQPEVNMAPLIDMVFILLIFFLVTTSFVKQAGIEVERPQAASTQALEQNILQIAIRDNGTIYMSGQPISLFSVRAAVRHELSRKQMPVVIVSDRKTPMQAVVDVMDECKLAGATQLNVATEPE